MKQKISTDRYYIEPIGEDVNLYAIPHEERIHFWKEHPLAKEVDRKDYFTLLYKLQQHDKEGKEISEL